MKTIIKIFICLSLIYTPFFAFAGAAENWELVSNTYDQERNRVNIEARKITQSAANNARYKVEIPVNPSTLGSTIKMMLKGGVASAAVYALVEGVGWIIDDAKNIRKRPIIGYIGTGQAGSTLGAKYTISSAKSTYESYMQSIYGYPYPSWMRTQVNCVATNDLINCWVPNVYVKFATKDPTVIPPTEYPLVSDSELGNEILGNGTEPNSSPQASPAIITDAYSPNNPVQDAPAPQQTLDALDNANPEPETEPTGDSKPKPNVDTDGDGKPDAYDPAQPEQGTEFQLPNFCSWAPAVCDFFTVQKADNKDIKKNQREQIEQDKTFFEKVSEWLDWTKNDSELPDTETNQVTDLPIPELQENAISWSASCPPDVQVPINLYGQSSTLTFSWSPWCQLLNVIKPAIIASAYIGAAFIVLGLRT